MVGSGDTPQEKLELALANEVAWNIFGIIGSLCFTSLFVGLSLLSLSMRGEGKAGDAWAAASVFVFAGLVGVGIASTGLSLQAVAIANEHGVAAGVPLQNIGDALSGGFGLFFGIAAIMLGTTIALQKTAPVFLGWLFALVGVFLLQVLDVLKDHLQRVLLDVEKELSCSPLKGATRCPIVSRIDRNTRRGFGFEPTRDAL